jgi:hypothetical protein
MKAIGPRASGASVAVESLLVANEPGLYIGVWRRTRERRAVVDCDGHGHRPAERGPMWQKTR